MLVVALLPATLLLAQTEPGDWTSYLLNGGPFALVLLLIVLDKIGTHSERDRLRIEVKELREELKAQNDTVRREVVPPLLEVNRLLPSVVKALERRRS